MWYPSAANVYTFWPGHVSILYSGDRFLENCVILLFFLHFFKAATWFLCMRRHCEEKGGGMCFIATHPHSPPKIFMLYDRQELRVLGKWNVRFFLSGNFHMYLCMQPPHKSTRTRIQEHAHILFALWEVNFEGIALKTHVYFLVIHYIY